MNTTEPSGPDTGRNQRDGAQTDVWELPAARAYEPFKQIRALLDVGDAAAALVEWDRTTEDEKEAFWFVGQYLFAKAHFVKGDLEVAESLCEELLRGLDSGEIPATVEDGLPAFELQVAIKTAMGKIEEAGTLRKSAYEDFFAKAEDSLQLATRLLHAAATIHPESAGEIESNALLKSIFNRPLDE